MIQIQNLTASYGTNTVIRHFCLQIPSATLVALVGNNGTGKSTFLKALANLIPYKGEISYPINTQIAYLGQHRNLQFDLLVKDIVVMGRFNPKKLQHNYTNEDFDLAYKALCKYKLEHTFNMPLSSLSGGMQQLVWLAQIEVKNANIILLDEPLQFLDLYNKNIFMEALNTWVKTENKTVIFSTHDIDLLKNYQGLLLNFSNLDTLLPINEDEIENQKKILMNCYSVT